MFALLALASTLAWSPATAAAPLHHSEAAASVAPNKRWRLTMPPGPEPDEIAVAKVIDQVTGKKVWGFIIGRDGEFYWVNNGDLAVVNDYAFSNNGHVHIGFLARPDLQHRADRIDAEIRKTSYARAGYIHGRDEILRFYPYFVGTDAEALVFRTYVGVVHRASPSPGFGGCSGFRYSRKDLGLLEILDEQTLKSRYGVECE